MLIPPVSRFMTVAPCSVAPTETVPNATRLMREQAIRHLPVLDGAHLVGVVSDRDLQLLEMLAAEARAGSPLTVADAMTTRVLTVAEDARLDDVVDAMMRQKAGSAVVMGHGQIAGIFTTTDALAALRDMLDRPVG
jgi:acetoin utilization protein AcuB